MRTLRVVLGVVAGLAFRIAGEYAWDHMAEQAAGLIVAGVVLVGLALNLPENFL